MARTTGTDAVLWRIGVVVLTFFHGLGVVLYLLGYVLIPAEGEEHSLGQRLVHGPDRHLTGRQVVLLAVLLVAVVGFQQPDGVLVLLLVLGLLWLWWRGREQAPALAAAATSAPGPVPAPVPAPVGARRSPYGALVASLALLTAGVLVVVGTTGGTSVPAEVVVAAALAVVGAGLVVGAFSGSSPGLVVLAVVLCAVLAGTAGTEPFVGGGVGERTWRPQASADYRLGVGDATLDLGSLLTGGAESLTARVEVGQLVVVVPDRLHVVVDVHADLGDAELLGATRSGHDVSWHADLGPADAPVVRVRADVRLGHVEVRRG